MRDDNGLKTGLASESAHYYDSSGRACYSVKAKAGHDRPTTLADARKLNLFPSVTTIIACAAKPGLDRWKQSQLLLSAMTLPRGDLSEQDWMDAVLKDSQEQARKAAEIGTATHAAIERSYKSGLLPVDDDNMMSIVLNVKMALLDAFGEQNWVAENSFTSVVFGYGCKLDLMSRDGDGVIVDFKGVETISEEQIKKPTLLGYEENCMQLAAQQVAAGYPEARCANVFFSRSQPGVVAIREWDQAELSRAWQMFRSLLNYWQCKNKYFPGAP